MICFTQSQCSCFAKPVISIFILYLATSGEYELLHDLNDAAVVKYSDMAALVSTLKDTMTDMNEKCKICSVTLQC